MPHNMTVTIEDNLWREMNKHKEIRWSVIMRDAVKEKLSALDVLNRLMEKTELSEKEIEEFSIALGKKVSKRR